MLFLDEELTLGSTDRYIYDYVCRNLDTVVYMRVRELAEACNVSPSTIMRFCERFGCKGYSEFRFRLQEYAAKRGVEAVHPYDVSADISFLEQMRRNVYERELAAAKAIIDSADILFLAGMGASGIAARYGQYYFSSFVGFSVAITHPGDELVRFRGNRYAGNIVVIALSVSGETRELLDFVDELKCEGARIISVTGSGNCSLADRSDVNIATHRSQGTTEKGIKDTSSQIPVLATVEYLARMCAMGVGE